MYPDFISQSLNRNEILSLMAGKGYDKFSQIFIALASYLPVFVLELYALAEAKPTINTWPAFYFIDIVLSL